MRGKNKIPLAIVMPAYNEEACIAEATKQWLNVAKKVGGVLIVVDDGSRDRTGNILEGLQDKNSKTLRVIHQGNAGHGAAIRTGYFTALYWNAEYIFQTDSDLQFTTADFWTLWERRLDSPFILGVRAKRGDTATRKNISKIARYIAVRLFDVEECDFNVPYRLMEAKLLRAMLDIISPRAFAPNLQLAILAKLATIDTLDVPVQHRDRTTGRASLFGWNLIEICLRNLRELLSLKRHLPKYESEIELLGQNYPASHQFGKTAKRTARGGLR